MFENDLERILKKFDFPLKQKKKVILNKYNYDLIFVEEMRKSQDWVLCSVCQRKYKGPQYDFLIIALVFNIDNEFEDVKLFCIHHALTNAAFFDEKKGVLKKFRKFYALRMAQYQGKIKICPICKNEIDLSKINFPDEITTVVKCEKCNNLIPVFFRNRISIINQ
jgi:hypothetical protein